MKYHINFFKHEILKHLQFAGAFLSDKIIMVFPYIECIVIFISTWLKNYLLESIERKCLNMYNYHVQFRINLNIYKFSIVLVKC